MVRKFVSTLKPPWFRGSSKRYWTKARLTDLERKNVGSCTSTGRIKEERNKQHPGSLHRTWCVSLSESLSIYLYMYLFIYFQCLDMVMFIMIFKDLSLPVHCNILKDHFNMLRFILIMFSVFSQRYFTYVVGRWCTFKSIFIPFWGRRVSWGLATPPPHCDRDWGWGGRGANRHSQMAFKAGLCLSMSFPVSPEKSGTTVIYVSVFLHYVYNISDAERSVIVMLWVSLGHFLSSL